MPNQPEYPLVEPGDPETTYLRIEAVLALLQEYAQARALAISTLDDFPPDAKAKWGEIYVISHLRAAVTDLGHMAMPEREVANLKASALSPEEFKAMFLGLSESQKAEVLETLESES